MFFIISTLKYLLLFDDKFVYAENDIIEIYLLKTSCMLMSVCLPFWIIYHGQFFKLFSTY